MLKKASIGAALAVMGTSAFAAVPEAVKTAISTAQTDAVEVAGLVFAAIVAVYAFKLLRRAL